MSLGPSSSSSLQLCLLFFLVYWFHGPNSLEESLFLLVKKYFDKAWYISNWHRQTCSYNHVIFVIYSNNIMIYIITFHNLPLRTLLRASVKSTKQWYRVFTWRCVSSTITLSVTKCLKMESFGLNPAWSSAHLWRHSTHELIFCSMILW